MKLIFQTQGFTELTESLLLQTLTHPARGAHSLCSTCHPSGKGKNRLLHLLLQSGNTEGGKKEMCL